MKLYFKISDIVYEISGDIPPMFGQELREYLFENEPEGKHKLYVELKAEEAFPPLEGNPVYQSESYMILKPEGAGNGWLDPEHRIFMSKYGAYPSACYIEMGNIQDAMKGIHNGYPDIRIEYKPDENRVMNMTFMEYFSIDRHLACEDAFIMHSCYVEHENAAIIFTAPSGTGKTTQGNLWKEYAGAHVVNGDRCILKVEGDGSCRAYSLPFCGSSSINHNRDYPVKAIVYLAQGKENVISAKLSVAFLRKLMSQTTFSAWACDASVRVIELYDQILKTVSCVQFACTPDEAAMNTLREYLDLTNV